MSDYSAHSDSLSDIERNGSSDEEAGNESPRPLSASIFPEEVAPVSLSELCDRSIPFLAPNESLRFDRELNPSLSCSFDIDALEILVPVRQLLHRIGTCGAQVFGEPQR